ncbi:MAG: hypothetical protein H0X34_01540 [Chthoniobacterales bacterium]|nr:hypothetical protein [Chthoniobacterales bacterium]
MNKRNLLLTVSAALLVSGCAWAGPTVVNAPVGPRPPGLLEDGYAGFLTVYSATEQHRDGDNTYANVHTDYQIHTPDGHLFKQVSNSLGPRSEIPVTVKLPKGFYSVVAQSETMGAVTIPVVVGTGKTTELHLEREKDWRRVAVNARESDLVRLPNGQIIGYRGR